MQDIEVNCPSCGHRFAVLGILEGDRAVCPGCLEQCDVPGRATASPPTKADTPPEAPTQPAPRRQTPAVAAEKSPAAKPKPEGKLARPASPPPKSSKMPATLAIGAVALVAVGAIVHFVRSGQTPAPAPPPEAAEPALALSPAPAPTPAPAVMEAPPPAVPEESPERAEMRRIATLMLQRYPLAQPGEILSLTLRNGMVYEGVFRSADDRFVVLERDGDPVQVAVNTLTPASRARVDNEFRFQLIKDLVRVSLARQRETP